MQYSLSQAEKLKMKFTPYSGLGMTAFYYTFTETGITIQGMVAIAGTNNYSAASTPRPGCVEARRPRKVGRETLSRRAPRLGDVVRRGRGLGRCLALAVVSSAQ